MASLIEKDFEWLIKPMLGNKSLLMLCVTRRDFSLEKFKYLLTEKKIDIEKVISSAFGKRQRQNFVDVLLEDVCDVHKAELLLGVLQFEEV